MPNIRLQKVADQIRDELFAILRDDVDETRRALVTVTGVTLSADMRHARVFVSIFPETADRASILGALGRRRGRIRHDLGRALRLRHVPELDFRLDTSAEDNARIDQILRSEPGAGGQDPEADSGER